jgi:hypothetical protein
MIWSRKCAIDWRNKVDAILLDLRFGVRMLVKRLPWRSRLRSGDDVRGGAATLLVAVAAIMGLVGLLAAFGPARRALRIQAIDALRADG